MAALSSIATKLDWKQESLLARFVPRANGEITLGLMTPDGHKGGFIMNQLPYEADVWRS